MNTANTIMAKLAEVFKPLDEEVLAASQEWANGRVEAIRAFKSSEEGKAMRKEAWGYYSRLHDIAGGKTWYAVFNKRSAEFVENFVAKNCAATVAKRNAAIAAKLEKAGVTEVISEEFAHSRDGFDGVFVVNTDAGMKRVKISTVRAGGYNIQCLHLRVLTSVK